MLNRIYHKFKQDKAKFFMAILAYIIVVVIARLTASLSYVSQLIIKTLMAPFKWWTKIAPVKTPNIEPNPFWEWAYILLSISIIFLFVFGIIRYLYESKVNIALLCEDEISKITKRIESNPNSLTNDHVVGVIKEI